jgi:protoheme IX farnesyltransferase
MSAFVKRIPTIGWSWAWLARLGHYVSMIKSLQTGLLLVTAAAGYVSGCCLNLSAGSLAELLGSLLLAVSGSTVLNMAYDHDIDACMARTVKRPLPAGLISKGEAWFLGAGLVTGGLAWANSLDTRYAMIVLSGVFLDVVIYTILLKRHTPYSILIGGLAGGMPVLAGRVLATGRIDGVGLLLALGVLFWIPTHILTFTIKYAADYARAGVPTFPAVYGVQITRRMIAISTLMAAGILFLAAWLIGLANGFLAMLGASGLLLSAFGMYSLVNPGPRLTFVLYKSASVYMLIAMLLFIMGGL